MVAGVIAAVIRRGRKEKPKRKKLEKEELVPHRSNISIKPFPQFGPKWVKIICHFFHSPTATTTLYFTTSFPFLPHYFSERKPQTHVPEFG